MTCTTQVIYYFRLVVLIAAILAVPITKVPADHPLVAESDQHAACSEMGDKEDKSTPTCCLMSVAAIEADVPSFSPDSVFSKLRLSYPVEGNGADPEPLRKPPRGIA